MGRKVELQTKLQCQPHIWKKPWEHIYLLPILVSHIIQCPLTQISTEIFKSVFFTKLSQLKPTLSVTQATTPQFLAAATHKDTYSLPCHLNNNLQQSMIANRSGAYNALANQSITLAYLPAHSRVPKQENLSVKLSLPPTRKE